VCACSWLRDGGLIVHRTVSEKYAFNVEAVKLKRRVIAPYNVDELERLIEAGQRPISFNNQLL